MTTIRTRSTRRSPLTSERMALEREDILDPFNLRERQLDELRMLREEAALKSDLLRRVLARLESIERTQGS